MLLDGSFHCGAVGSAASWECWDAGLIPSCTQRLKDLALLKLRLCLHLWLGSYPWPRNSICSRMAKKKKKLLDGSSNSTPGHMSKGNENRKSKR